MSDVFVSYKAEDRRRVKPLVEALEAEGYSVWWDEQIGGGAQWRHTIESELNAAKCVIVAWRKRSVGPDGTFVQDEATRAQERHVYIPVLIDKVHLPLGFGELQALPLVGWKGNRTDQRYRAILAAVERLAGTSSAPAKAPATALTRRTMIASGAAATATIAGVGTWALLKPTAASAASDSIAVLPFANLSGDPAQAYFSDGIAEELRSALARLAGLKVVGRTSSEAVRDDDAETAAKKLGVGNILTGSVRQSPSTVRVAAQLIDGRDGLERWSESYDRTPGDSIKIQTDIAENVARSLSVALSRSAGTSLTVGGTQNAAAQNLLLQAQEAMDEGTRESTDRALQLVDEAIKLDPNYAEAYARKSIYSIRRGNSFATTTAELNRFRDQAVAPAQKALALAPNLARAHVAMALIHQNRFDLTAAYSEFRRAMQLAPGDAALLRRYSYFLARLGDQAESLRLAHRSVESDPLDPDSHSNLVGALFDARRYSEAVDYAELTKRRSAELFQEPLILGFCLLQLGKLDEAQQQFALARPDEWERITGEALLLVRRGDRAGALKALARLQEAFGDNASYQVAEIQAQLGDREKAIAALEQGWRIRDGGLVSIKVDPFLDPIRSDSRFSAIVDRMNFPA